VVAFACDPFDDEHRGRSGCQFTHLLSEQRCQADGFRAAGARPVNHAAAAINAVAAAGGPFPADRAATDCTREPSANYRIDGAERISRSRLLFAHSRRQFDGAPLSHDSSAPLVHLLPSFAWQTLTPLPGVAFVPGVPFISKKSKVTILALPMFGNDRSACVEIVGPVPQFSMCPARTTFSSCYHSRMLSRVGGPCGSASLVRGERDETSMDGGPCAFVFDCQ
jgi:hypothetical protein